MIFIIPFVFWLIGLVITSFTLVPILIILFFGIPATKKLEKIKMLEENNNIVKRYLISLIILLMVFLIIIIITFLFFKSGFIGFLVGVGMTFLFSLGKLGKNQNNIGDYMDKHQNIVPIIDSFSNLSFLSSKLL